MSERKLRLKAQILILIALALMVVTKMSAQTIYDSSSNTYYNPVKPVLKIMEPHKANTRLIIMGVSNLSPDNYDLWVNGVDANDHSSEPKWVIDSLDLTSPHEFFFEARFPDRSEFIRSDTVYYHPNPTELKTFNYMFPWYNHDSSSVSTPNWVKSSDFGYYAKDYRTRKDRRYKPITEVHNVVFRGEDFIRDQFVVHSSRSQINRYWKDLKASTYEGTTNQEIGEGFYTGPYIHEIIEDTSSRFSYQETNTPYHKGATVTCVRLDSKVILVTKVYR